MIKRYRLAIALFLTCALGLHAADSGQQQPDTSVTAVQVLDGGSNAKAATAYSYADYALLGGAAYLMYIYSYFAMRDAVIAIGIADSNLFELDRFARFFRYSFENLVKLCIVGGLTYKTVAAHAQEEPVQETATVQG